MRAAHEARGFEGPKRRGHVLLGETQARDQLLLAETRATPQLVEEAQRRWPPKQHRSVLVTQSARIHGKERRPAADAVDAQLTGSFQGAHMVHRVGPSETQDSHHGRHLDPRLPPDMVKDPRPARVV